MKTYFATLARYNVFATRKLFEHIDAMPEDHYRRDAGLFSGHPCPEIDLVWMLQAEAKS